MKKIFTKYSNRILSACLCICACILLLYGCGGKKSFSDFTKQLFIDEISSNTINLHFTLEDPKSYGIKKYEISYGDLSKEARTEAAFSIGQTKLELLTFPYTSLSTDEKLTYDILGDYLDTNIALCQYDLYAEYLSPNNGLQIQLPILMAEYEFNTKQDVVDYLELLALTDEYYEQIISFEKEKAEAGLFMSDSICTEVIESCKAFLKTQNNSFLTTTFENRINEVDGLSKKEINKYINKNASILEEQFFPSYEYLIDELTALLGSGTNNLGLCYYTEGKSYYEQLVYSVTGCNDSLDDLFSSIDFKRNQDLIVCADLQEKDVTILDRCASLEWEMDNPNTMLATLEEKMLTDFPECPDTTYEIQYVDECLEDYLSPAFYITAPIDDYYENSIYINNAYIYNDIYYFTTLAHEGYPGHLFQTVYSYSCGLPAIRSILNYPGYVEGWATYVEYLSYDYADVDADISTFLSHNQSATLSLYASSDIGIHYYGWDLDDMYLFWESYGIADQETVKEIYDYILSEPANYLKYYVGYLGFLELKDYTKELYGSDFSLKEFHETVLEIGPAPFHIIEKYIPEYYDK